MDFHNIDLTDIADELDERNPGPPHPRELQPHVIYHAGGELRIWNTDAVHLKAMAEDTPVAREILTAFLAAKLRA